MLQKGFSSELIVPFSQNLYYNNTSAGYKHRTPKHWKGHFHAASHEIMNKEDKVVPVPICINKVNLATREHKQGTLGDRILVFVVAGILKINRSVMEATLVSNFMRGFLRSSS